jgi:hypothetical protein
MAFTEKLEGLSSRSSIQPQMVEESQMHKKFLKRTLLPYS